MPNENKIEQLIDALAISVAKGFERNDAKLGAMHIEFTHVKSEFVQIHSRLDRIEFLLTGQERRVSTLEDRVRQLATKAGYQFN